MPYSSVRLSELAGELGRAFEGDGDIRLTGVADLASAGSDDLSFARSASYAGELAATRSGAVILPPDLDGGGRAVIRSPIPGLDFARAVRLIVPPTPPPPGVDPTAVVDPGADVDPLASVGPGCAVGARTRVGAGTVLHAGAVLYSDVRVGEGCEIHARCVLREGTELGDRVILQPGVVVGGDGYGYVPDGEGGLQKFPQVGGVVIEDDVEIGANTTIDRGSLSATRIGRGAKIDSLVQVGHNCRIGENALIVSQAGLAGSTVVERGAIVMGQAGLAGHLTVGERAVVGPKAGVHKDVAPGSWVFGSPQREASEHHREVASLRRLPSLLRRVRAIERRLGLRGESDSATRSEDGE